MHMLEVEIYSHIVRYLSGAESLQDFRRWYDSASWGQAIWENELASAVELVFAEYSSGHRTADELTAALHDAVSHATLYVTAFNTPSVQVTGTSQSPVKSLPTLGASLASPGSAVGKLREVEYA